MVDGVVRHDFLDIVACLKNRNIFNKFIEFAVWVVGDPFQCPVRTCIIGCRCERDRTVEFSDQIGEEFYPESDVRERFLKV